MSALPHFSLTPQEYLELERKAEFKSEYANGYAYVMTGASENHNAITLSTASDLLAKLRGRCRVYANDMKVWLPRQRKFTYPDVSVVCGERRFYDNRRDVITNPTVIIEVLSDSTAAYDRGDKFLAYQQLESLRAYVLVAQHRPVVEQYIKQADGSWQYMAYIGLESALTLATVECVLNLRDVYADVVWENEVDLTA